MKALLIVPVVALAACATAPQHIEPVAISSSAYAGASCSAVRAERAKTSDRLAALSAEQQAIADRDNATTFWFGVPASQVTGINHEEEIGNLKGRVDAMDARLAGC